MRNAFLPLLAREQSHKAGQEEYKQNENPRDALSRKTRSAFRLETRGCGVERSRLPHGEHASVALGSGAGEGKVSRQNWTRSDDKRAGHQSHVSTLKQCFIADFPRAAGVRSPAVETKWGVNSSVAHCRPVSRTKNAIGTQQQNLRSELHLRFELASTSTRKRR